MGSSGKTENSGKMGSLGRQWLRTVGYVVRTMVYFVVFFEAMRLVFMAVNGVKASEASLGDIARSMGVGMVYDMSMGAYVCALYCVVVALLGPYVGLRPLFRVFNGISLTLTTLFVVLLPANAVVYSYWGQHFGAEHIALALAPGAISSSVSVGMVMAYVVAIVVLGTLNFWAYRKVFSYTRGMENEKTATAKGRLFFPLMTLVVGGLMIIPIRGGVGIAPLNPGRAYFSDNLFVNHMALNPVWNFTYSIKRAKQFNTKYEYMTDEEAERRFEKMMRNDTTLTQIVKTKRPNVIFILLESFSAHGIGYLGGENVTPNLDALLKESVAFDNIMAASDRSGKGLVAAMCGYQVLPTISIIQYPQKSQSLPFLSRTMRKAGYESQTFIYGGDLGFNNFNTIPKLGRFDKVIEEKDFASDEMGDKWGAHDEYTFNRLLSEANGQKEPFFDFYFTLSSHEPFTVPMETKHKDEYLNSMCYTDSCLGDFIRRAKETDWWDNTLIVMTADHGHPGPEQVAYTEKKRFSIPLIFTGGALAVRDTMIHTYGSQTDIAATLLAQLGIDHSEFRFSKDLLSRTEGHGFAFYDYSDAFGYIAPGQHNIYDNAARRYIVKRSKAEADTVSGRAYLQMVSKDYHSR